MQLVKGMDSLELALRQLSLLVFILSFRLFRFLTTDAPTGGERFVLTKKFVKLLGLEAVIFDELDSLRDAGHLTL